MIKYFNTRLELRRQNNGDQALGKWERNEKPLDWFSKNNAKAYMVLLD